MKSYKFKINNKDYSVEINEVEGEVMKLAVNGTPYTVTLDQPAKEQLVVKRPVIKKSAETASAQKAAPSSDTKIQTPLPGTIMDVMVAVGDTVKEGQAVVILEAMKMENKIEAEVGGVVKEVKVRKGDSVLESDVLVVIGKA